MNNLANTLESIQKECFNSFKPQSNTQLTRSEFEIKRAEENIAKWRKMLAEAKKPKLTSPSLQEPEFSVVHNNLRQSALSMAVHGARAEV